jgi:hypothetical protein
MLKTRTIIEQQNTASFSRHYESNLNLLLTFILHVGCVMNDLEEDEFTAVIVDKANKIDMYMINNNQLKLQCCLYAL